MLLVGEAKRRNCQGVSRRELLQVGGASLLGASLADALAARRASAMDPVPGHRQEVSCIVLWLDGGPSQFETFDPKPEAPDNDRGPWGAIDTSLPGVRFSELLPLAARWMDRCTLIRSLNHTNSGHQAIPMLTGREGDATAYGAVVTHFQGFRGAMPPYVHIGSKLAAGGGRLGNAYNPLEIRDPSGKQVELPQFSLTAGVSPERFQQRRTLLSAIDAARAEAHESRAIEKLAGYYKVAAEMLTSSKVREAFELHRESEILRDAYGASFFGQSCLMARRLVEAGTRFVQIKWYDGPAWDAWDVHGADLGGMDRMEQHLCPRLDQALTVLFEDLKQRGLWDTTLVVVVGEFGRTPQINKYGARDHWPYCFSALLAGGGAPAGRVVGASDAQGGRPAQRPVSPGEFAATLYKLLGLDATVEPRLRTFLGDAFPVSEIV